jgi:ketosteroid isomerase-like protein
LERRLARLEDDRAILRTLHAYGHAIDAGDEAGWVACFAEDGVFAAWVERPEEPWFRVAGRAGLEAFIAAHTRPPDPAHKHLVIEPLISVEGDAATCVSYFAVLMEHGGEPLLRVFGRYHDRLVRGEDGWRFRERVAEIQSMKPGLPALAWGRNASLA